MMRRTMLGLACFLAWVTPAFADDAVEAAASGNIVFEKAPEIIMQDETLTISKSTGKRYSESNYSVDVDFHFKNTSDHDVTRKIAFALPAVDCSVENTTAWQGLDNATYDKALKDFTVQVDGKPLQFTQRSEAMLNGKPITDLLTKLNIPLNPCKIQMAGDNLPDRKFRSDLQRNNLLNDANFPAWKENIYFEWTQVFPANKVINIRHHYTPVVGATVPVYYLAIDLDNWFLQTDAQLTFIWHRKLETLKMTNPFVVDTTIEDINEKRPARYCLIPSWVRYHLTTGAYWNGGIGLFKLIVKDNASAPFAVNQFFDKDEQVKKIVGKNTLTFTAKNFTPSKDLLVLFLSVPRNKSELKDCRP